MISDRIVRAALVVLSALALSGCGAAAALQSPLAPLGTEQRVARGSASGALYILNDDDADTMTSFVAASDNKILTIKPPIYDPRYIAVDSHGTVYIGGLGTYVYVYDAGKRKPSRILKDVAGSEYLAVDKSDYLFVAGQSVYVYKPGGRTAWKNISDGVTEAPIALGFDPEGNLYVCQWDSLANHTGLITVYDRSTFSLLRSIRQGVNEPRAIAFDSAGDLFVANEGNSSVTEYATGSDKPNLTITDGVDIPNAIAVDAGKNLYVSNLDANEITVYDTGSTTVSRTITQGVEKPRAMVFDAAGNLYVATGLGVKMYPPGSGTVALRLSKKNGVRTPFALAFHS